MKGSGGTRAQGKEVQQRQEGEGGALFTVEMREERKSSEVNDNLQRETKEHMKREIWKKSHAFPPALRSQEKVLGTNLPC